VHCILFCKHYLQSVTFHEKRKTTVCVSLKCNNCSAVSARTVARKFSIGGVCGSAGGGFALKL